LSVEEKPTAAFVLSLLAGILIVVGAGTSMIWFWSGGPTWGGVRGMMGMMGGMMTVMGFGGFGFFLGMGALGLVSGIIVLLGAVMLHSQPHQAYTWGIIILVFSVLSLFGMGGFIVGSILGVVGGALALIWKPTRTT